MKKTIITLITILVIVFSYGQDPASGVGTKTPPVIKPIEKPVNDTAFENLMNKSYYRFGQFLNDKYTKKDWDFIMQNLGVLLNNAIIEWNGKKKKN